MKKNFTGCWIPNGAFRLLRAKKITSTEAFLLGMVWGLSQNPKEACSASNGYFARVLGLHKEQVKKLIRRLDRKKLIYREVGHRSRLLKIKDGLGKRTRFPIYNTHTSYYISHKKNLRSTQIFHNAVDRIDLACARELKEKVNARLRDPVHWRIDKQAVHFAKKRKQLKDDERFFNVFEWY